MKIKECPNCRIVLHLVSKTGKITVYRCPECGYERTVEQD